MIVARFLVAGAIAVLGSSEIAARAQSAPASHFGRTATTRTAASAHARAATPDDPLAPYDERPRGATSAATIAAPPRRPAPRPAVRNYYPTARVGRYSSPAVSAGHRCTPSRGLVFGMIR